MQASIALAVRRGAKALAICSLALNGVMVMAFAQSPGDIIDASKQGDLTKVQTLLRSNPALVFRRDQNGVTALHWAALRGYRDVAEILLANRADANAKDNGGARPLHYAAQSGSTTVVELLLANKAEANVGDDDGTTPLHYAAYNGHKDVAELLLANKADVNVRDKDESSRLVNRANVDARDKDGKTPLHNAAYKGHRDVAELLLANKADVNGKDNVGQTPLLMAAAIGHKEVVELLLAHGANANGRGIDGRTALELAVSNGHNDVAEVLRQQLSPSVAAVVSGKTPSGHTLIPWSDIDSRCAFLRQRRKPTVVTITSSGSGSMDAAQGPSGTIDDHGIAAMIGLATIVDIKSIGGGQGRTRFCGVDLDDSFMVTEAGFLLEHR